MARVSGQNRSDEKILLISDQALFADTDKK